MFRMAFVLTFILFSPSVSANPITAEQTPEPLGYGQGYLVLDLRLEQRVTEISFRRVNGKTTTTFGPYEKGRHLLLIPLAQGKLRLEKVASPSYDLPFRYSYSGYDRMEFNILPKRVNYFAQIIVGDIRSSYGFELHVRNRLAYSYAELTEKHGQILAQYPINYSGNITDHFYNEFLNPVKQETNE